MSGSLKTPINRDTLLDTFAAELTRAAYRVALRSRTRGTWLDLELALWRALDDTVKTWGRALPLTGDAAHPVQGRELP
jgi:hypothetical protein